MGAPSKGRVDKEGGTFVRVIKGGQYILVVLAMPDHKNKTFMNESTARSLD